MKWLVIDNNEIEENVEVNGFEELREFVNDMLNDYFEPCTTYGNPVDEILMYVDDCELVNILIKYNYTVRELNEV